MSNPEDKAATPESQNSADSSLQARVHTIVKQLSVDESGKLVYPDELKDTLDADTKFAVDAEHRRRSTQSAYTKGQQEIKAIQAENEKLLEQLTSMNPVVISKEDQDRLDNLKYENPDEWRLELDKLERAAKAETSAKITELTGDARRAAESQHEITRRQQVLEDFNASAETPITDEIIANEVPPRITKKLDEGKITFEEFLEEVNTYIHKSKTVKTEKVSGQPNMGDLGGGKTPTDMKPEKTAEEAYSKSVF